MSFWAFQSGRFVETNKQGWLHFRISPRSFFNNYIWIELNTIDIKYLDSVAFGIIRLNWQTIYFFGNVTGCEVCYEH